MFPSRCLATFGTLAACLAFAAPASAATATDVRCFMLSNLFAQKASTEPARRLAQASGFYYLGKIQEMAEGALRQTIAEQQKMITVSTAPREMQQCAQAVQESGLRIQRFAPTSPPATPTPPRR